MDTLTSSEFRRRYASLTQPTTVTVNGHAIGTWIPGGEAAVLRQAQAIAGAATPESVVRRWDEDARFNTRPFTPVPKHGK